MQNLLPNIKIDMVEAGAADGTSALTSDAVDMQDYEGVVFIGRIATHDDTGTGSDANQITVQQSDAVGSGFVALPATETAPTANGGLALVDVFRPAKRYVRIVLNRATSTVTGDVYAIRYAPRIAPVTQDTGDVATTVATPAE